MIVVDASAVTNALTDDGEVGRSARAELALDPEWAAPAHLIVEVFSAVRGRWLGHRISRGRAIDALDALPQLIIDLVDATPLVARMWELRDNVTGYDAAYLAAAETLDCPLVTSDARLSDVPGVTCEVRVVPTRR